MTCPDPPVIVRNHVSRRFGLVEGGLEGVREALEDREGLEVEYQVIGDIVREEIEPVNTVFVAGREENRGRNRWRDMVPYDGNIVRLNQRTGSPPSDYTPTSLISFPGVEQRFLATQAPRPGVITEFWCLVLEQQVKVIVMLTELIEGNKIKADQYWPEQVGDILQLDHGIEVEYLSCSNSSNYIHRRLRIGSVEVDQIHCTHWKDKTAPDSTQVMLELQSCVSRLNTQPNSPILVHCSAGVGRTGTFIGFYSMVLTLRQGPGNTVSVYETVLQMRRCRRHMVQKCVQYMFLYQCLRDFLRAEMCECEDTEGPSLAPTVIVDVERCSVEYKPQTSS